MGAGDSPVVAQRWADMLCLPLDSTVYAAHQADLRRIVRIPYGFERRKRLFTELVDAVSRQYKADRETALDAVHQCLSWLEEDSSTGRAA